MPTTTTPLLIAAVFCEKVLYERDGTLSAIRIVDRISVVYTGPTAGEIPVPQASINLLIMLKSGSYKGAAKVTIRGTTPSGEQMAPETAIDIGLKGEAGAGGANVVAQLLIPIKEDGVHWFAIDVNGETVTRTPLDLQRSRPESPTDSQPDPVH